MSHKVTQFTFCFLVLFCLVSYAFAGEPTFKSAELKNEVEDVIFPRDDMVIVVNYAGRVNLTAKMQAFSLPDFEEVWYKEIPLGKAQHRWPLSIWVDESGTTMFVGNGPLCALDVVTGDTLWSVKYEDLGIVQNVEVDDKVLIVAGTEKKGTKTGMDKGYAEIIYETVKSHLENPKLLCLDRNNGTIKWEFKYEEAKAFDLSSCVIYANKNDISNSNIFIKGKYIYCVNGKDGSLVWKTEDKAEGKPSLEKGILYANIKEYLVAMDPANGSTIWKVEEKLDEHSRLIGWYGNMMILLVPGKEKDGIFEGKYKLYGINSDKGEMVWKFEKGKNLGRFQLKNDEIILTDKEKFWIIDPNQGNILSQGKNEEDYDIGFKGLESGIVFIYGKKGIACYESYKGKKGGDLLWKYKGDLAERGGGFLSGLVSGMMALSGVTDEAKHFDQNMKFSPIYFTENVVVFPTKKRGIQGISYDDGSVVWTLDIKDNPFVYAISPYDYCLAATKKEIHYVKLKP